MSVLLYSTRLGILNILICLVYLVSIINHSVSLRSFVVRFSYFVIRSSGEPNNFIGLQNTTNSIFATFSFMSNLVQRDNKSNILIVRSLNVNFVTSVPGHAPWYKSRDASYFVCMDICRDIIQFVNNVITFYKLGMHNAFIDDVEWGNSYHARSTPLTCAEIFILNSYI